MLNIFPTLGRVTQKQVDVCFKLKDHTFKTCDKALTFCNEVYQDLEHKPFEKCTFDFFEENFCIDITFHNSDDVFTVKNLPHLIELSEHC